MTNDTDLANHALALISEEPITAITDQASTNARTCRTFVNEARLETLRMGRWNCATKRATLTALSTPPLGDYAFSYQLPADYVRLMEVNGEAVKTSDEYFEIEGKQLLTDSAPVWIRYIADIGIGACDPLLQAAIAVRLAQKIALPLSARLEQADALEGLFQRRLKEAQGIDAKETQSAENAGWEKVLGRSRLGRVRGARRNPLRIEG